MREPLDGNGSGKANMHTGRRLVMACRVTHFQVSSKTSVFQGLRDAVELALFDAHLAFPSLAAWCWGITLGHHVGGIGIQSGTSIHESRGSAMHGSHL